MTTVAIVGAGHVGVNLARYFHSRGICVASVITTRPEDVQQKVPEQLKQRISTKLHLIPNEIDWVLLAVSDSSIRHVASALAKETEFRNGTIICHTSGSHTSEALLPLANGKRTIGSFHPIQSFSSFDMELHLLENLGCGIEGEEKFLLEATRFARELGWKPLMISKKEKIAYHLACVFAGNFLTALCKEAETFLAKSIEPETDISALIPMMETVLHKFQLQKPEKILTGPIKRGDVELVKAHLEYIRMNFPEHESIYKALALRTLSILPGNNPPNEKWSEILQ